jgi:phage terminase small subunit
MKLNPKQERFVQEYLVDLNATQAAIRAGYSEKTASSQGERLLRNVEVKRLIQEGQKAKAKALDISKEKILKELARIAFSNITNVMDWNDNGMHLIDSVDLPEDVSATVAEVVIKTKYVKSEDDDRPDEMILERKVKLYDKQKALELLGKHIGLFEKKEAETDKPFELAYPNPRGKNAS